MRKRELTTDEVERLRDLERERMRENRHPSVSVERNEEQLRRRGESDDAWRARLDADPNVQAARERFLARKAEFMGSRPKMPEAPGVQPARGFCEGCEKSVDDCRCESPARWV